MNQVIGCAVEQTAAEWKISAWTIWVCNAARGRPGMVSNGSSARWVNEASLKLTHHSVGNQRSCLMKATKKEQQK